MLESTEIMSNSLGQAKTELQQFRRNMRLSLARKLVITKDYHVTVRPRPSQRVLQTLVAVNQLALQERQLLIYKYLVVDGPTNIALCLQLHLSERTFYRRQQQSLLHFAEAWFGNFNKFI